MTQPTPRRKRSIEVEGVSHGSAPIPMGARVGNTIYSSGIMGKDPSQDALPADAATQARFMFAHLRTLLANGGATLDDVVHLKAYVADNAHRAALNAATRGRRSAGQLPDRLARAAGAGDGTG